MTNRLDQVFSRLSAEQRTGLIPFVTAGFPHRSGTATMLAALAANGADVIELGMPFSDPMADGSTIARASEQAIRQGTELGEVLADVARFRESDDQTGIVLMGYANPLVRYGIERFARDAHAAGVDGVLVVDVPLEEATTLSPISDCGLALIRLLAPTSSNDRMQQVANASRGFVYYVALTGVTGAATLDVDEVGRRLDNLRELSPVPVAVGFGIKSPDQACRLATHADAVVIGSALVDAVSEAPDASHAAQIAGRFVQSFREALDA